MVFVRLAWETGPKRIQVEIGCHVMVNWLRGIEKVNTSFAMGYSHPTQLQCRD